MVTKVYTRLEHTKGKKKEEHRGGGEGQPTANGEASPLPRGRPSLPRSKCSAGTGLGHMLHIVLYYTIDANYYILLPLLPYVTCASCRTGTQWQTVSVCVCVVFCVVCCASDI